MDEAFSKKPDQRALIIQERVNVRSSLMALGVHVHMVRIAERGIGVRIQICNLSFEIRWLPHIIVVEKGDELATRPLETAITRRGRTHGGLVYQDLQIA